VQEQIRFFDSVNPQDSQERYQLGNRIHAAAIEVEFDPAESIVNKVMMEITWGSHQDNFMPLLPVVLGEGVTEVI